jgi:probable HAF family extracellular repeat protein
MKSSQQELSQAGFQRLPGSATNKRREVSKMKNRVAFFVIALTLGLTASKPALAQSRTYTTIDVPGAIESGASSINNLGQIVGGYVLPDGSRHGFLYSGGVFTTIDDPNGLSSSEALGINNSGQIVGAFNLNSLEGGHVFEGAHAFLYNGGIFTTLDYPAAGVTNTTASRINNSSNIVGVYRLNFGPGNGFLDVGGGFSTVNVPAALGCCTHDNGINDAGDIVGQFKANDSAPHQGFMDLVGVFTALNVPGAFDTIAEDINNSREVVGFYRSLSGTFGFLDSAGTFSTIAFPGARATQAIGINDQGDIVGLYQDASKVLHGFLSTAAAVHVFIDVKPAGCPNPFNVGAMGDLPVAILGTASFDVTTVDPTSVRLQGVPALRSALEDVATPFTGPLVNAASCSTAGPDGFMDLVLHFGDQAVSAALGAATDGQVLILTLTGNLLPQFGGTAIKGQDVVIVINK